MGNLASCPDRVEHVEEDQFDELKYGVVGIRGWRNDMEDEHVAYRQFEELGPEVYLFCVFDGHGGAQCSEFCSKNIAKELKLHLTKEMLDLQKDEHGNLLDEELSSTLTKAFLSLDEKFQNEYPDGSMCTGSTSVSVLITSKYYIFMNIGDSRALMVRDNRVFFSTEDHKPSLARETKRITDSGTHIIMNRVQGSLAVSRAFGDFNYKNNMMVPITSQAVISVPDVTVIERNHAVDNFIVLSCDGIWDVMKNEEVAGLVHSRLQVNESMLDTCRDLINCCLVRGSSDNMTSMVIALPAAPQLDKDLCKQEFIVEGQLRTAIEDMLPLEEPSLKDVMDRIASSFSDIPGGVGIAAKTRFIESLLDEVVVDRPKDNDFRICTR